MDLKTQNTAVLLPIYSVEKLSKALVLSEATDFGMLGEELLNCYLEMNSRESVSDEVIGSSVDFKSNEGKWHYKWQKNGVMRIVTIQTTSKGYEVLAGSDYELEAKPSLYLGYVKLRDSLEKEKVVENGKFVQNYTFKSTSAAASVARGMQLNGPKVFS